MDRLRIPKRRALVDVTFVDGGSGPFAVFLAEQTSHGAPERVSDLLDEGRDLLPALDTRTETMSFLSRAAIAYVCIDGPLWDVDELNLPIEHEVEVLLQGGQALAGLLSFVLPHENSRVADYLNTPAGFFALVQGARIALINKRHVQRVTLR